MLKIAHLAEAFGMQFEVHHSENSHNNLANLHASLAISNCSYFEVLQPDGAHKFGLEQDLEVDANGLLHAPTEPGIGARIDFDLVKTKTIAQLT
jgi:L-alanine-DL-glutamate epimerase-like enolase superfamily enzyme